MLNLAKLFGKSPFAPLYAHMEKVYEAIKTLNICLDAFKKQDFQKLCQLSLEISEKEHNADLTKYDIRNNLPKSLLMPIQRTIFLEILNLQDDFANKAQDIAALLSLREMPFWENVQQEFDIFWKKNIDAFDLAHAITKEYSKLLETSFGGVEAQKVKSMIDQIYNKEYEIDTLKYGLLKKIYNSSDLDFFSFDIWHNLIKEVGAISNIAEKYGNKIRSILELK